MKIQLTKTAIKSLKRLDTITGNRIINGINNPPLGDIKRLQGYSSHYRLRIGNFRIIYQCEGDTIIVSDVLPRGEAYKKL